MKTFYVPVCVLAVILGFSFWAGCYVEGRTEHWNTLLAETDKAVQQDNWTAAEEQLERIYSDWGDKQTFFHVIMEHEELDKAENYFAGAFAMCREEERSGTRIFLAQLMTQLHALAETQSLGIKNIL